jgi:hypothetical protein
MSITKNVPAATANLLLNDIATGTMVVYSTMTTNPANAAAITGVIAKRTGMTAGAYTVTSGVSVAVNSDSPSAITASGTGTVYCAIVKTGTTDTDGIIKLIDTVNGATGIALTSGQQYTPASFTYTLNQPT